MHRRLSQAKYVHGVLPQARQLLELLSELLMATDPQTPESASKTSWSLTGACAEGEATRMVSVSGQRFVVGRWEDVDLRLAFRGVSKHHAVLSVENDCLAVADLNSTNGTFVNGHRIHRMTPLKAGDFVQFVNAAFQVTFDQPLAMDHTQAELVVDRATTLLQFDRLMSQKAVTPHFQPIVTMGTQTVIGFEVLARSRVVGLESAQALFEAAAMVQQEVELSRLFRNEGLRSGLTITNQPELFLNTHPAEMNDDRLIRSLTELRDQYPTVPLTLEVHEATVTDADGMRQLFGQLKELDMKLAYDDFGAGQARLVELVDVPPDYLKFDRKLIQDIHTASTQRQQMLAALVRMARDLGIEPLAEGVELAEEAEVCQQLGFTLAQGYLFGRPQAPSNWNR